MTGGDSWALKQASAAPIKFPHNRESATTGWRTRADAATKSYDLERSDGARWQRVASFLVNIGSCKQ